jgi:hypothetical protein
MLRLVTQFDDPSARPSVATPTCAGCCSCCCCCIATSITTSAYTAMSLSQTARSAAKSQGHIETASCLGWAAIVLLMPGAVAIIAIIALYFSSEAIDARLPVAAVLWPLALYGLYRYAGARRPIRDASRVWFWGSILFTTELVIGFIILAASPGAYLVLALLLSAGGIWGARRLTHA